MGLDASGYRVLSVIREAGTDAGESERRFQESLFHAFAFFVPVDVSAVALVKPDGREAFPVMTELGLIYCVNVDCLAFAGCLVIDDTESVSRPDREEVNGPGIDVF